MTYTITEEKKIEKTSTEIFSAIKATIKDLEGKILREDQEQKSINIQFPKTIHGKVLGDRTVMQVYIQPLDTCIKLLIEAYPVDAVGRKLMFGARKGITKIVLEWFWEYFEQHLN